MFSKKWWNTPPNENDLFGTRIRKTFQFLKLFFNGVCTHPKWEHRDYFVHGENYGPDRWNRFCSVCGQKQRMMFLPIGPMRYFWKNVEEKE